MYLEAESRFNHSAFSAQLIGMPLDVVLEGKQLDKLVRKIYRNLITIKFYAQIEIFVQMFNIV